MTDVKVPIARCAGCTKEPFGGDLAFKLVISVHTQNGSR